MPVHNDGSEFCPACRVSPATSREPPKLNLPWLLHKWQVLSLWSRSCGSCTWSIPSVLRSSPCFLNPCSCTELPGLFCVRSAVQDLRTLWCTQTPLLLQVTQSTSSHIQHLPYVCWGHPVSFYAPAALQQAIKYLAIDFIRSFPFPETRAGSDH